VRKQQTAAAGAEAGVSLPLLWVVALEPTVALAAAQLAQGSTAATAAAAAASTPISAAKLMLAT
jgi:hypothetical protein